MGTLAGIKPFVFLNYCFLGLEKDFSERLQIIHGIITKWRFAIKLPATDKFEDSLDGATAISHINAMVDRSEKNGLFENSHLDKI